MRVLPAAIVNALGFFSRHRNRRHWVPALVGVGAVAVLATGGVALAQGQGVVPRGADHGIWRYTAHRTATGQIEAYVEYRRASVADLRAYADANRQLTNTLATKKGQADVQVTYKEPLSPDVFRNWSTTNGLTVAKAAARTLQGGTMRGTIGVAPGNLRNPGTDPLPLDLLNGQLEAVRRSDPSMQVRGVYAARGTVDASHLTAMIADPRVFLLDVTPTVVRQELAAGGVIGADRADVDVATPFWNMEDLGLQNFQ